LCCTLRPFGQTIASRAAGMSSYVLAHSSNIRRAFKTEKRPSRRISH
jgi:hypothetical protein